ncbi:Hemolysin E [Pseudolycoriella hygida]|uniref:Hemolysin E n=1 Tax=Pseudolycoriella hygida TaxID=35572 RepID=A0A9Q0N2S8_9DIPT|nr:Hemolysin E [Pseudolycoriella hygida]
MSTAGVKEVIEITKEGIEALNQALDLYNKVLDQIIPWKTYEETVKELDRYREDYSNESAQLVGEVKTLIYDAEDNYYSATQSIYEWCSLTIRLLQIYLNLFNKRSTTTYEAQRALLISVLGDGIAKMSAGQAKLQQSSINFNNVAGKLTTLNARLTNEFSSKSSYFQSKVDQIRKEAYAGAASGFVLGPFGLIISYAVAAGVVEGKLIPELEKRLDEVKSFFVKLHKTIDETNVNIDSTKTKLKNEIANIGELKVKTEETKELIPFDELDALRDNILESVNNLIKQCEAYQKSHAPDHNSFGFSGIPLLFLDHI